ncbi:DMT family transporter [Bradyrhizobium sp. LHD-71]|uniref:DMT family transporter n=1 Tax=Bradyrhizobium sp. LHD-71 TaxID=3072141 RepID=UPI00280EBD10|nr:DMT family transporter [Bradyrhizobium sp. LHD-71]MDQ8732042.1 DMT family transporter [Bradyrhizobium sp. LHD-71]
MSSISTQSTAVTVARSTVTAGILFMLASITLYSCLDALAKWTVTMYAAAQFLLIRSTTSIAVLLPFLARNNFAALRNVPRPGLQAVRVALSVTEVLLFLTAIYYLPLADAITCYLSAPILVVALSAVFLGEQVGWRRWLAVLVGFIGVVIAMRPSTSSLSVGVLIAIAGAFCSAVLMIVTRELRGTSQTFLAFSQMSGTLLFGAVVAPFQWVTPEWTHVGIFLVAGLVSVGGLLCANRSLSLAPASVLAPYKFTAILFAALFGYMVFGDIPPLTTIIGAAIIVASGLFIFMRERKLARPEPVVTPQPG